MVIGWIIFGVLLASLLAVDLFVHRHDSKDTRSGAAIWTVVWVAAGLGFGLYVWHARGTQAAEEYLAAYLIEKSLSIDNLFVFLIIFQALGIHAELQRRVLTWGIIGALFFRAAFIFI